MKVEDSKYIFKRTFNKLKQEQPSNMIQGCESVHYDHCVRLTDLIKYVEDKNIPVQDIPIEELAFTLEENYWFGHSDVSIGEVAEHYIRIHGADLDYPIIVIDDGILDGAHRYIKAVLLGHKTIKGLYITEEQFLEIPGVPD